MRIRLRSLKGRWGVYFNGQITLHRDLKHYHVPSKQFVKFHELAHLALEGKKIKLSLAAEEKIADIYALGKCRAKDISYLERILKKILQKKYGKLSLVKLIKIHKEI